MVAAVAVVAVSINRLTYRSPKILTTKSISEPVVAEQLDIWAVLGIATLLGIQQLLVAPVAPVGEQNLVQSPHRVVAGAAVSKLTA